jgi:tetratricopeptide (TPR) repeat protein
VSVAVPRDRHLQILLLASLAVLLAHAWHYRFLCDDAFISFRYARNLAEGHGLVFNPGFERVEGFTNPSWVLLLGALAAAGAPPEVAANVLTLLLTVALFWLVTSRSLAWLPPGTPRWVAALPVAWLAVTRSIAVWSTSGLETRLFEVLVVGGVFGVVDQVLAVRRGATEGAPWPAAALGLAAWTRPDGLLIGGVTLACAGGFLAARTRLTVRSVLRHGGTFGLAVGALFAARLAYYGTWLPNTYYAKVDGKTWWGMGGRYLAAFALEYGVLLWVPAIVLGVVACLRARRLEIPVLFAAAVLPHAAYVASIGGDHFEYRPLDLYFPFAFVILALGIAALAVRGARAVYAVVIALGLVAIPWAAYRQFPREDYIAGFPGLEAGRIDASEYLALPRIPGAREIARAHRAATRELTRVLAGVRREEHVLFGRSVTEEARYLGALVRRGAWPPDTHVAIGSVGIIPYVSDLRTLDRFGLTDADVARLSTGSVRFMAHEKVATIELARHKGVDLWAVDPVHLLFREDDPVLIETVVRARATENDALFADVGEGWWLLARPPQGAEALSRRMPEVSFASVTDADAIARLGRRVVEAATGARKARALDATGDAEAALAVWRAAAAEGDPEAMVVTAIKDAAAGRDTDALTILERLSAAHPRAAEAWYQRGLVEVRAGRAAEGAASLARALAADPDHDDARYTLTLSLVLMNREDDARRELRRLERRRPDLAAKVRTAMAVP